MHLLQSDFLFDQNTWKNEIDLNVIVKETSMLSHVRRSSFLYHMSRIVRKPAFCICENKGADQLRGNRKADQRICIRYTNSTISLLPKSKISSL